MEKEIKIKKVKVETKEQLDKLYNCSALTLEGLQTDNKNLQDFAKWIKSFSEISDPLPMYITTGETMNKEYGLTQKNKYSNELTIVSVDLKDIKEINKIILPRFAIGGRWFDDIVNNNQERQDIFDNENEEEF